MSTYRPRSLIPGHKVHDKFKGRELIAIPDKKFENGDVEVFFGGQSMVCSKSNAEHEEGPFKDKFGRSEDYMLYYFTWSPPQETLI